MVVGGGGGGGGAVVAICACGRLECAEAAEMCVCVFFTFNP